VRRIERTNAFRPDFKRELRGRHRQHLESLLKSAIEVLADDKPLPESNRDHALAGEWRDHRDCHLKPDLLLIYRKVDDALQLVRLWGHIASCSGNPDLSKQFTFPRWRSLDGTIRMELSESIISITHKFNEFKTLPATAYL
jgi:mRNA interferase YafQ